MRHRRKKLTPEALERLQQELTEGRNPRLADIIERNIGIIELLHREAEEARSKQDKVADAITAFSGSMVFLYFHIVWFGVWILVGLHVIPGLPAFDPFPFGLLTMVVSLEAIFLSTLVMISQNRQSAQDSQREMLDLQIDLLAEYEITRMLRLVDKMAEKMGIEDAYDEEIDQLCEPVAPEVVLQEILVRQRESEKATP
jgi:uncharacterized membrane protein